ncbi:hypothetical protein [Saccharopolyspora phatthalungensis]|uniref:SHOCT domain-containing protein n=1 Tax=Saccharopolyspora phatthalungensis TaxID=664693 RepID=A0A840Q6E4_9PSEU|nr:hypothetical protein [Saccharopolyspora phatthalungensis]MBB5154229.1 hypothetical protein [Saccharopolyspora phatthalungensis]
MTWQDELQNLDAELAAGRISAEEYRQRRDAVLGRAQDGQNGPSSGGFPQQQPHAGTPSGGFPQQQPQQQANPFPPAFSWGDAAAQGAQQQSQQGGVPEEATQVVPNPLAGAQQRGDSESTQVVNLNQPPQWGPQQSQWGPQQGWGAVESSGTPWGDDLPGTPEHGDASWMRQGPEVFETAGKPGKGKLIAGLSIGGVLLIGLIIAGIFYFTSGGSTPAEQTAAPAPPPPVRTKQLPAPPPAHPNPPASSQEVLVPVSGPAHPWTGALDLASLQGAKAGLLQPKAVLDTAVQSGLIDGWFNGTEGATPKTTLLTLQLPNPNAAKSVVDQYLAAQQGLSTVDGLSYQGVKVVNTGGTFRTAYVAHNWAVIIDVSGASDQKEAARQAFKSVLDQQLNHTPPTVRD